MSVFRWVFAVPAAGVFGVLVLLCLAGAARRACRKLRALGMRLVSDRPVRDKHPRLVPGLPCDGKPLSVPMQERLEQIERGYGRAPRVARRVR